MTFDEYWKNRFEPDGFSHTQVTGDKEFIRSIWDAACDESNKRKFMYKIVNPKAHFLPLDIVQIKESGCFAIIKEVNLNECQDVDEHQWSYSIISLVPKQINKVAWYKADEFIYINNFYQILSKELEHPFLKSPYEVPLSEIRRDERGN